MTPKRSLKENFSHLDEKIQAAAYSQLVNKFYFFNDRGWLLIYSGNGGDDDRVKFNYRQTGLRMVPSAMFVSNDRLFSICRNQIWVASVSAPRLYFSFHSKLKSQFPSSPSKLNGAFTDSTGAIFLIGSSNLVWRYTYQKQPFGFTLDTCYPKKITQSLLPCR